MTIVAELVLIITITTRIIIIIVIIVISSSSSNHSNDYVFAFRVFYSRYRNGSNNWSCNCWCVGPLIPICGHWLAKSSILHFLLHLSVLALALSSQFFPYSKDAPKRLVFQHTVLTAGTETIILLYVE
jgi:hypothetical protein